MLTRNRHLKSGEPLGASRRGTHVEGQVGAVHLNVETIEDISTQKGIFLRNGYDFEVAESGSGYFQGDCVRVYHRLYTIIALGRNSPGRQQTKLINKVNRDTGDISAAVSSLACSDCPESGLSGEDTRMSTNGAGG